MHAPLLRLAAGKLAVRLSTITPISWLQIVRSLVGVLPPTVLRSFHRSVCRRLQVRSLRRVVERIAGCIAKRKVLKWAGMTQNLEYSVEELYQTVREMAAAEGVETQEQWNDMVEVVLNQKIDWAEVEDDDDTMGIREDLRAKYREYQKAQDQEAV